MYQYFLSIRKFSPILAIALAALGLLAISGCGGSDDSSANAGEITVEASSLSKSEFIKQADAICRESRAQLERNISTFGKNGELPPNTTQEDLVRLFTRTVLVPTYQQQIDEIAALGAPNGDTERIAAMLNALSGRLDAIQRKPVELSVDPTIFSAPGKMARSYGLIGCAEALNSYS